MQRSAYLIAGLIGRATRIAKALEAANTTISHWSPFITESLSWHDPETRLLAKNGPVSFLKILSCRDAT
jgi:hypothetical protein